MDKDFMIDYLASLAITYAAELEQRDKGNFYNVDTTYDGRDGALFAMREQFTEDEMELIVSLPIVKQTIGK